MEKPIAVDLFSGAGGLSLGLEQAGFDVACCVEYDPIHAGVHAFNFPECDVIVDSVANVTARDVRRRTRIGDRKVSVVVGGPPCQGFSMMGKRILEDPRNKLALEYVRLVAELDADYFVFENVKGLTLGDHVRVLHEIIERFDALGYDVVLPWTVLNAKDFGVPQSRERLIMLGHRKGLPAPAYPSPLGIAAVVTCAEAIGDLPDLESFPELVDGDSVPFAHDEASLGRYALSMRPRGARGWHDGEARRWDAGILTSSARTDHSETSRARFAATPEGDTEPVSRFFRLPRAGICNTLRAGTDAKRGAFTSPRPIHYERARCVSVREMARLHGFPDWFRLHVTKAHGAREIGNAVPPPLAHAVAAEVRKVVPVARPKRRRTVPLGDPALLSFDMGAACAYWGVEDPIGSRDTKQAKRRMPASAVEERPAV